MKKRLSVLLFATAAVFAHAETLQFSNRLFSENFDGKTIEQLTGENGSLDFVGTQSPDKLQVAVNDGKLCFIQSALVSAPGAVSGAWNRIRKSKGTELFMLKTDLTVSNISSKKLNNNFAKIALSNSRSGIWGGTDPYAEKVLQSSLQIAIKLSSNGQWGLRDYPEDGPMVPSGTTATLWIVVNGSGNAITYKAPDGSEKELGNDQYDVWMDRGTGPIPALSGACQASKLKLGNVLFNYNPSATTDSSADITFDNIEAFSPTLG